MLAHTVNSLVLSEYVPEAAHQLPIIATYYFFNIGFVSISVACSVCVLNFHFRGSRKSKVPKWLKKILFIKENRSIKILNNIGNIKLTGLNKKRKTSTASSSIQTKLVDECNKYQSDLHPPVLVLSSSKENLSKNYDLKAMENLNSKDTLEKILLTIRESLFALKMTTSYVITDNTINDWKLVAIRVDHILFVISCIIIFGTPWYLFGKYFST